MLSLFIKGELPDSLIALTLSRQFTYRRIPPRLLWPASLALPALLLWVAGCATVPSCPPTLPTLAPGAKDAESIAGRYQDKGAAFSKNGDPLGAVSLTCLLFRPNAGPDTQLTNSDFVVLVGPRQDVLEAQSWQGNRQLANSHWQRLTGKSLSAINKAGGNPDIETYRWHKQFLMLFTDVAVLGPGFIPLPVFSAHEQSLQMRKAVDGSLIVFHRNAHTLLFAFAPLSHRQDVWCRFPPASAVPSLESRSRCRLSPARTLNPHPFPHAAWHSRQRAKPSALHISSQAPPVQSSLPCRQTQLYILAMNPNMRFSRMTMVNRSFRTAHWLGALMLCGLVEIQTIASPANYKVREILLSGIPATAGGGKPLVSSDNRQVAFPVMHRGQWCVSLNGVEGPLYRKVSEWTFSPDGKRLAYAARKEFSRNVVVLDGKESVEYEYLPGSLTFSPDSRQLAFDTATSNAFFVVVEGKRGPDFEALCRAAGETPFFFSPDAQKLAYACKRVNAAGVTNSEVVVEGDQREVLAVADNAVVYGFSPDGQHLAYSVQRSNSWQVVVDGKADRGFDGCGAGSFRFSSNSQHRAYFAGQGGKWMAVFDGKAGAPFDGIGDQAPVFSSDGSRSAYVAVRREKRLVVIDGHEGPTYDGVHAGSLRFSPDGQHVAFGAVRGLRHFVVRDGKEEEVGEELKAMFFSPDSRHLAYASVHNGKARWVVDDKPGKAYDGIADKWACFSPDSQHLAYGAARGNNLVVVVNELEVGVYDGNFGTLAFEGPNLLCGVVTRMNSKFDLDLVRLEIQVDSN